MNERHWWEITALKLLIAFQRSFRNPESQIKLQHRTVFCRNVNTKRQKDLRDEGKHKGEVCSKEDWGNYDLWVALLQAAEKQIGNLKTEVSIFFDTGRTEK